MDETSISVTIASRKFSDCINRVRYHGTTFVLEKNGVPVARIVPVKPNIRTESERLTNTFRSSRSTLAEERHRAKEMTVESASQAVSVKPEDGRALEPVKPPKRPALNW